MMACPVEPVFCEECNVRFGSQSVFSAGLFNCHGIFSHHSLRLCCRHFCCEGKPIAIAGAGATTETSGKCDITKIDKTQKCL
mmetsp:Transcript_16057/g.44405  ORF Transcript_16057/g.44405 Transcript_16057/m.44405 type:complete len:82 (+) Transcript_16057:880-1125(+)